MSGDQLENMSIAVHIDIDGPSRFILQHREIDESHSEGVTSEQQRISVLPRLSKQGRARNSVQISFVREPLHQLKASMFPGIHFLERDDIGIELSDHAEDSFRVIAPVSADAGMDIICGESQAHYEPARLVSVEGWRLFNHFHRPMPPRTRKRAIPASRPMLVTVGYLIVSLT